MPFVQGKCESCGGILTVDPNLKAANCPFCGAAYVVQDSINFYKTTINVDTIHADVVNVSDESSSEGRLRAAEAYMKMGKYDKAEVEYKYVTEAAPQDYRGWLGLIEIYTNSYSKRIKSAKEIRSIEEYANTIKAITSKEESLKVLEFYNSYISSETSKNSQELRDLNDAWDRQEEIKASLESKRNELDSSRKKAKARNDSINGTNSTASILSILGAVMVFSIIVTILNGPTEGKEFVPMHYVVFAIAILMGLCMVVVGILLSFKYRKLKSERPSLLLKIDEYDLQIKEIEALQGKNLSDIQNYQSKIEEYK